MSFAGIEEDEPIWQHAVLVTSLDLDSSGVDPDRWPNDGLRTTDYERSHSFIAIVPP